MSQPLSSNDGDAVNAPVREPVNQPIPAPVHEPEHAPQPGHEPDPAPEPEPETPPVRDPSRAPAHEPVTDPQPNPESESDLDPHPHATAPVKHSTKRVPNSRATAVGDRIFAGIADPAPEVAVNPTGALILIADDEPNILISLEYLMKREGYRVSVARDGKQALEAILSEHPALVLLDVMMPKKSGFEVCQEVRANDSVRDTLILMLTAKGRDTDLAKGLGSGADAYMTKPFSTKELVVKVRAMLDARV